MLALNLCGGFPSDSRKASNTLAGVKNVGLFSAVHSAEADEDGHAGGGGGRALLSSEPGAPAPLSGPDPEWSRWEDPAARRDGGGAWSGDDTVVVILKRCAAARGVEVRMRTYRGSSP